jgi:hypothetical protein
MDSKIEPSQIYTTQLINDQVDQNQDWGEKCASTKILHISEMVFQSTIKDLLQNFEHDRHYYVGILRSPINIEK